MSVPDKAERARATQAALAERAALVQRLQAMPQAMRERPQWLVWRFIAKPGASKPAKVPFYASGQLRGWPNGKPRDGVATAAQPQVEQGHDLDRAALVTLDQALEAFNRNPGWAGVGFAFLPGDGLIGVDIDGAIDPATGEVAPLCAKLVDLCASYTELSPSGKGVHIILAGDSPKFKSDDIGLEVYAAGQYFACTGRHWAGTPLQVQPADPMVLAYMRELVDAAKEERAKAKAAARQAAAPPSPPPAAAPAPQRHQSPGQQGNDFARINAAAYQALHKWVPRVLPAAQVWRDGYRITSKALGRDLQEDLKLCPDGIMDFGEERGMSPADVVMAWQPGCATPKDALHWLADALSMPLAPRGRPVHTPGAVHRPEPPPEGELAPPPTAQGDADPPVEQGDAPTGADDAGSNVVHLPGRKRAPRARRQGEGDDDAPGAGGDDAAAVRPKGKIPDEVWALVHMLEQRFALIYSTDAAWDCAELMIVKISAMRLAFGKTAVNLWLSRPAPLRRMVRPVDLVFEPGQAVVPPAINMFAGLDLEPVPCQPEEVAPMLRLLRHLCSESDTGADDVDAIMHWVLCWQALPTQQLGTKMASAIVMHGAQGTGKNLYWDLWRDLFGVYGVTVGQTELEDKFNGWVSRKLAIIGDEVVSRQEMYHNKNRLKLVVTQQDKFPIRGMLQETRWESNHANVVFLSNESQPLALEERDRRYLVVYTPLEADAALYEEVRAFKAAGGAGKWLYYLQNYNLDGFTAHTKPLMTAAKEALIEAAWKAPARFGFEWLEGYLDLPVNLCSAEQLYRAFRRWCDTTGAKWPPEQAGFTAELKRWVNERVKRGADGKLGEPRLHYKPIALKDGATQTRKTVRCWVPQGCAPLNGVSEGDWAWEGVAAFENTLHRFCRRPGPSDDEA